jgi:hypothetical protein
MQYHIINMITQIKWTYVMCHEELSSKPTTNLNVSWVILCFQSCKNTTVAGLSLPILRLSEIVETCRYLLTANQNLLKSTFDNHY